MWTVRLIKKFSVHTLTKITSVHTEVIKLVCAVIKLESLIMAQNVRWRHALYMQVERSSNTEWQTGEYDVGICLLVWNNLGKPELILDKPLRGKLYAPKDEPALD